MTGGQPVDGPLSVQAIAHSVRAEGVNRIALVSDEPELYSASDFPLDVSIHHRRELDAVQRELRDIPGVTVLIYAQTCATEKRRRRKRGLLEDPKKHVVINDLVCEGCGDCSVASNCLSVVPKETPFGRKRQIDQDSCNKDYSCVNGFLPELCHRGGCRTPPSRCDPRRCVPCRSNRRVAGAHARKHRTELRSARYRGRRHGRYYRWRFNHDGCAPQSSRRERARLYGVCAEVRTGP